MKMRRRVEMTLAMVAWSFARIVERRWPSRVSEMWSKSKSFVVVGRKEG